MKLIGGVREALGFILSFSSFTRPVKAVNLTKSFTRSVYVVCTLIEDSKDNSSLFHSGDAGENFNLNAS